MIPIEKRINSKADLTDWLNTELSFYDCSGFKSRIYYFRLNK